ncbi:hypothetical protein KLP28_11840 [Nocardioidaceae bacterium]|nr:hypothetical protein KLP28_11840 [Nocardioidaceae bacterium]
MPQLMHHQGIDDRMSAPPPRRTHGRAHGGEAVRAGEWESGLDATEEPSQGGAVVINLRLKKVTQIPLRRRFGTI